MHTYSTTTWRHHRARYLRSHPHCLDCAAPATQPDHVPPRTLLIALGVTDPDHDRWLQPRCDTCHSRKTQTIDVPLLRRWHNGEDAAALAEQAMSAAHRVG